MVTEMREKIGILFFVLLNAGHCLEIRSTDKEIVENVGNSVVLDCTIIDGEYDPWGHTVTWYKVDHDGVQHQINTLTAINSPFSETDRYDIEIVRPNSTDDFIIKCNLLIQDVMLADNGTYECQLSLQNTLLGTMTKTIFVPASVESFDFISSKMRATEEDNAFEFEELESSLVKCTVTGGNPQPKLQILRDGTDITSEFELISEQTVTGVEGLHYMSYETSLSNKDFKATRQMREQTLQCEAKFTGHSEMDESKKATIEVKFEPTFSCHSHQAVPYGSTNYTIQCKIEANPPVIADTITWFLIDTNVTISENEPADGYIHTNDFDAETGLMTVNLFISNITNTSYQEYILNAANEVSDALYEIILSEAEKPTTLATTTQESTLVVTTVKEEEMEFVSVVVEDKSEPVLGGGANNMYSCLLHIFFLSIIVCIMKISI